MRREKFTDGEKALVDFAGQTHADRVKIITDIKVAKSNDRYAEKMTFLTFVLGVAALIDVAITLLKGEGIPLIPQILLSIGIIGMLVLMVYFIRSH
jgi:hypothetical protein